MQFLWPPENETKVWSELHFTNTLITNCLQIHHSLQADKMSAYCPVLKKEEKRKQAGKQKTFRPASLSISVSAYTTLLQHRPAPPRSHREATEKPPRSHREPLHDGRRTATELQLGLFSEFCRNFFNHVRNHLFHVPYRIPAPLRAGAAVIHIVRP